MAQIFKMDDPASLLNQANQDRLQKLSPTSQAFYADVQFIVYTSVEANLAVEQGLQRLITQLEAADQAKVAPEKYLGQSGHQYSQYFIQSVAAARYSDDLSAYHLYIFIYIMLSLSIVAIFEFLRGSIYYRSLSSGLNMPVAFSILGWPLQILLLLTASFFFIRYRRQKAFRDQTPRSAWQALAIACFALVAGLVLPYLALQYHVFMIKLPVWLVFTFALVTGIAYKILTRLGWQEDQTSIFKRPNDPDTDTSESQLVTDSHSDQGQTNLWQTLLFRSPLVSRKNIHQQTNTAKKDDQEDKQ
ncbi:hypothetical protein AWM75_03980 [Aerococcus urinaehominis]|uniref:Uncharacterized protein n=1 Tax=Aerococcus urinaehominis TaxID=128944 RepID=A0A0X8FKY7_9LACT|nr:hypothetical protein [Aerococcus urinaehominis]AMB99215.1 hypothetical protein AWM75_03980 [Aerococcus urinaehominis]SDM32125.1 hypothetical protein SAMN04487985_11242 [Aerococcus urinaehominis]